MMKKWTTWLAALLLCLSVGAHAQQAQVAIDNMGQMTIYDKAPERAFLFSYSMAEYFAALGLEDKVAAIVPGMYAISDVLPKYRPIVESMPLVTDGLVDGSPNSIEVVLAQEPDFAFGDSYNFLAATGGTPKDYERAGIKIYATEGTWVPKASLENTYQDILNLGKIFRVEERAQALVDSMRAEEQEVRDRLKGVAPVSVFAYDSGEGRLFTIGGGGLENELISIAGGKNIFEDEDKHYFNASIESVIERNPDAVLVWDYNITAAVDVKIGYLKGLAEMADVNAIRNNRFSSVPCYAVFPSIQNVEAIKTIAKGLHPELFK